MNRTHVLSRQAQLARFGGAQPMRNPVPQGQQHVAVGGNCGWEGRAGWGSGNYQASTASPNAVVNASMLPNMAPLGPANVFAGPGSVIRQALVPIAIVSQTVAGNIEKCVQAFPDHGRLYVNGVRGGNVFFEITITKITAGGIDANRNGTTNIDAGIYNSDDMMLPADYGCVQRDSPISVCFKAFGTPSDQPWLNLTFFGTRDQAWNSCEPGLALALNATGQYPAMVG